MRIVGIDLSLTATGLASIDNNDGVLSVQTEVIETKPDDGTLYGRHIRLESIAAAVARFSKHATLVVVEGPSYSSAGRGTWDRAGLWWWVVSVLTLTGTPMVEIPPTTAKKWATNNGGAKKPAVAVAIGRLWPDVSLRDDNDSDALVLATMGAQRLQWDVPVKSWQPDQLKRIAWPL